MEMCYVVFLVVTVTLWMISVSVPFNTRPGYQLPPVPPNKTYPVLLHEADVIRLYDTDNNPILIGDGTYAHVTLARFRGKGEHKNQFVVVKTFIESSFETIMQEVRIHRYLESLDITARLIGLLPSGHLSSNMSLVYEYLPFSKPISSWLNSEKGLTDNQWLTVCVKLTEILQKIHSRDVMYNDLHTGNVMIRLMDDQTGLSVRIIDFGFATYKHGKPYSDSYGSLYYYAYLAPEVKNHTVTSKATDVYSLGNIFIHIARKTRVEKLKDLSRWCMKTYPEERPSLDSVTSSLKSIIFDNWLNCILNPGSEIHGSRSHLRLCQQTTGLDTPLLKDNDHQHRENNGNQQGFDINNDNSLDYESDDDDDDDIDDDEMSVLEWLGQNQHLVSSKCPSNLFILDKRDIYKRSKLISSSQSGNIRVSKLLSNQQYIIIKDFKISNFNEIRREACNTAVLGNSGIAPKIIGLLFGRWELSQTAIVQEYFGAGCTLHDFVKESKAFEWDLNSLLQIPMHSHHLSSEESFQRGCEIKKGIDILDKTHSRNRICKRLSHRQLTLQLLAEDLTSKIISAFYVHGYILNNFNSHNIVVKSNFTTKLFEVKIIDLSHVTRLNGETLAQGYEYLSEFPYLAPEVKLGHRGSFTSDVFSLCYLVGAMLGDYIEEIISNEMKRWTRNAKAKYETFFSNQNLCFNGWENRNVYYSSTLPKECDVCELMTCEVLNDASTNFVEDKVCEYILLEQHLFLCLNGPSSCRPSLYTILKLLRKINPRR